MSQHFIHSGDLGDIIYALPAIKAMGGGGLHLTDQFVGQTHGMGPKQFAAIEPLLKSQPYIFYVVPRSPPPLRLVCQPDSINLNAFRWSGQDFRTQHLADCVAKTFDLPAGLAEEPWLNTVPRMSISPVIFARSGRYHNPHFPWKRIVEKCGQVATFIGTPAEHAAFNQEFGAAIPHWDTKHLDEVARIIAGCQLFIGNQSAPLAIAEGLGVPIVCEVCPDCPNCNLKRSNFTAGYDENVILPNLEELTDGKEMDSGSYQTSRRATQTASCATGPTYSQS